MRADLHAVHGGQSIASVGDDFRNLHRRHDVIDAEVLDAWYPPAPTVVAAIQNHLEWLIKTSPPAHAEGLIHTISEVRGVAADRVLVGAGTSSLMFEAFPLWLRPESTVLLLDPTYSEYPHLCERVVGCRTMRFPLPVEAGMLPDVEALAEAARSVDFVALVNPNSPNGSFLDRPAMQAVLHAMRPNATLWVDETYVDFAPAGTTLEDLAGVDPRVVVCKSMSKFYALSGLRVGYLVGDADRLEPLEKLCPPWNVGMMGQLAAIEALRAGEYYAARAAETHSLRTALSADLGAIPGVDVFPSRTNFVLVRLAGGQAAEVVARCESEGVYLRDCSSLGASMAGRFLRVSVKSAPENERIVSAVRSALRCGCEGEEDDRGDWVIELSFSIGNEETGGSRSYSL